MAKSAAKKKPEEEPTQNPPADVDQIVDEDAGAESESVEEPESLEIPESPVVYPPFEELTMLIYGDQGTGKTSFFGRSGRALILAAEPGAQFQKGEQRRVHRWSKDKTGKDPRMDFVTLVDAIVAAREKGGMRSISILVLDTVDRLHRYATRHVCEINGVKGIGDIPFGKGYSAVTDLLIEQFERLKAVIPFAAISHTISVSESKESASGVKKDVDVKKPSVDKRIGEWLAGEQNIVGYTYKAIGGKYLIKFHTDEALETKDRTGLLEANKKPFENDFNKVKAHYEAEAEKRGITLESVFS